MAFFRKLKDRLFKSSSRIDEGLEAIVEDGGAEETLPDAADRRMEDPAQAVRDVPDARQRDTASAQEAAGTPDEIPVPGDDAPLEQPVPDLPGPDPAPREVPQEPDTPDIPEPDLPDPEVPEPDLPEPDLPQPDRPETPDPMPDTPPEEVPEPPTPRPDPEPAPLPDPPESPEVPRPPEEALATGGPRAVDVAEAVAEPATAQRPGFLDRLLGRGGQRTVLRRTLDDDMLE
jgi:fused signal recognition particle receptor